MSLRVNDALLPQLAREFGVSLGQASQVISLFAIAYGVSQLLFGPLGDRFGKYRVIAWATAACAVTALACALAPGFLALRLAARAGRRHCSGDHPAGNGLDRRRRALRAAPAGAGALSHRTDRRSVFRRVAGRLCCRPSVLARALPADRVALRRCQRGAVRAASAAAASAARATQRASGTAWRRVLSEFAGVLALPWARMLLAMVFFEGMFLYGPFAFVASHVHEAFALSLSSAGALVMLFGLGGLLFALGSRRLVSRLGEAGLARWGGSLMCASLLVIAYAPAWGWVVLGCFVLGLGFYMMHNTLQVNATQMAPERRGAAVSAFAACFFLGQSAGVSLGGLSVGSIGASRFLTLGAIGLLVVSSVFVVLLGRRRAAA